MIYIIRTSDHSRICVRLAATDMWKDVCTCPRVESETNDGNRDISAYNQEAKPVTPLEAEGCWTVEEHMRFLNGLESFSEQIEGQHPSWTYIASFVETRDAVETKEHGERYLHALLTQFLLESNTKLGTDWTNEENSRFENALAEYADTQYAWTKIAMALPGKTVQNVMDQYDNLLQDISAIEKGHDISRSTPHELQRRSKPFLCE
jgi:hypothetical protein